jgi:carbon starvation protein CstA
MRTQGLIIQVLIAFVITLVTAVIVTLLWNLLIDKTGAIVDWKTSFLLAIVIGITLPIVKAKN